MDNAVVADAAEPHEMGNAVVAAVADVVAAAVDAATLASEVMGNAVVDVAAEPHVMGTAVVAAVVGVVAAVAAIVAFAIGSVARSLLPTVAEAAWLVAEAICGIEASAEAACC